MAHNKVGQGRLSYLCLTLFIVLKYAEIIETKIITATLGAIGSLLSSYIAAIY